MLKKNFKINNNIYPENFILSAIEDFQEVGTINYNEWDLIIEWSVDDDLDEIFNEFMNYVIWLINE